VTNVPGIVLYLCAAVVVGAGSQLLVAYSGAEPGPPWRILRQVWSRPVPWVAAGLVALLTVMAVAQVVHPAVIGDLQRDPGGGWWRVVTALLVQSSGGFQLVFNLAALIVVAPIAERVIGPAATLAVFLLAGVTAQVVSAAGWSRHGGGDSVAICGLVGALAVLYALRGPRVGLRRLALLIPAAAVVLLLLTNNHGVGLAVGCVLGVPLALVRPDRDRPRRGTARPPSRRR
jgi:rhomboid protease GluP